MVQIKRAYEKAEKQDGYRVLVDRLWPRGIRKTALKMNEWAKDLAPSNELRKAFGHIINNWRDFQSRYRAELNSSKGKVEELARLAGKGTVTLIYSAKDEAHNNAVVLKKLIEQNLKGKKYGRN